MKHEYKFFILTRVLYLYGSQGFKDVLFNQLIRSLVRIGLVFLEVYGTHARSITQNNKYGNASFVLITYNVCSHTNSCILARLRNIVRIVKFGV